MTEHLKPTAWEFWAGTSEEFYELGSFDTAEKAVAAVKANGEGGHVIEARIQPVDLAEHFDVEEIFSGLAQGSLSDLLSEFGEPDLFADVTDGQITDLQDKLCDVVSAWQALHKIRIQGNVFSETRNHQEIPE